MKFHVLGAVALALFAACTPVSRDANSGVSGNSTSVNASGNETATAPSKRNTDSAASAAVPAPATPVQEDKPMSYYTDKVADIQTSKGLVTIRFFPDVAPNHVKNFVDLSEKGFYTGSKFHRVIPGFMVQGGDPNTISGDVYTWGMGGSGQNVKAEFNNIHHSRGIVSMARSSAPDSASSQFFICVADSGFLDGQYTVFGRVTKGMSVVDEIVNAPRGANDRPNDPVKIESVKVREATAAEKAVGPASASE
jgi:cyclophilin family peptidyl-prolyl cis-trans isomerase